MKTLKQIISTGDPNEVSKEFYDVNSKIGNYILGLKIRVTNDNKYVLPTINLSAVLKTKDNTEFLAISILSIIICSNQKSVNIDVYDNQCTGNIMMVIMDEGISGDCSSKAPKSIGKDVVESFNKKCGMLFSCLVSFINSIILAQLSNEALRVIESHFKANALSVMILIHYEEFFKMIRVDTKNNKLYSVILNEVRKFIFNGTDTRLLLSISQDLLSLSIKFYEKAESIYESIS